MIRIPRLATAALLGLVAMFALACSDDATPGATATEASTSTTASSATAAGTATETAAGEAAAFPVTIEHKYGSTTIESEPLRVVSIGFQDHDFLLALGVKPIAVREWWGERPFATWTWALEALGDAEPVVLAAGELDIEAVAALQPDLIIGLYSGITAEQYELLSAIAPTVTQPGTYVDYGMPWQEQLLATGQAIGRAAEAEALLAATQDAFARIRAAHPEFEGKTAVIAGPSGDGAFWAYGIEDPRSRLLASLGFVYPPELAAAANDSFYATISAEQGQLLEADLIIEIVETEDAVASPSTSRVWEQLKAVQEDRVYVTSWESEVVGALSFSSPLSLPWALEQLAPHLAEKIE